MDFGEILAQWEHQTQKPYGKKRLKQDTRAKKNTSGEDNAEAKRVHAMELWLRRYGTYDKDAEAALQQPAENLARYKKKLRTMQPQAEIDLHGLTLEQAYTRLTVFFDNAVRNSLKKVLIIHGKGNHSQGDAVLSPFVKKFLEDHAHAGETGHPKARDGGTGSTWVILK